MLRNLHLSNKILQDHTTCRYLIQLSFIKIHLCDFVRIMNFEIVRSKSSLDDLKDQKEHPIN